MRRIGTFLLGLIAFNLVWFAISMAVVGYALMFAAVAAGPVILIFWLAS